MKLYTLNHHLMIRRSLEEVFAFFSRPENLALLTPPSLGFQILTPSPIEMKEGAVIDYTLQLFGLTRRWTTLITDFTPPIHFADLQLRGPYAYWHHSHMFSATDEGTLMTDVVRYALPLGILGQRAHELVVKHQLKGIFEYRKAVLATVFPESTRSINTMITNERGSQ